jgi:DNA polymerase-1
VTLEEAEGLLLAFRKAYPELVRGIERLIARVKRDGFVATFTGRIRRVPEVFNSDEQLVAQALRQAVNSPVQGGASDMTLMSMILLDRLLVRENYRSMVIVTVHDSIVLDCRRDEVADVAPLVKEIMENIPALSAEVLPGLDWAWLKVPLVAELDCGRIWGAGVAFDPAFAGPAPAGPLWWSEAGVERTRPPASYAELWKLVERVAA